ncbi:MAG: hypothetical protein HRT66_12155 [Flavobacteriaceae bacterium]|nr:hypothetical protein [Flavobacteriaceae bacterium]
MSVIIFSSCSENETQDELTQQELQEIKDLETLEFIREGLAINMVEINESLKPAMEYAKAKKQARGEVGNISFEEFSSEIPESIYFSKKGIKLLEASYELQLAETNDEDIVADYDAKELFLISDEVLEGKDINQIMYGDNYEEAMSKVGDVLVNRGWKSFWQGVGEGFDWIYENRYKIMEIALLIMAIAAL